MEIHIRFTYDLPKKLMEALGIDEFTAFSAFVEDGRLVVETEGCGESHEPFDEGYDEGMCAGLEEGYADGFRRGYRKGWSDREKGLPYDDTDDEPDDCPYPDRLCENCPHFCPQCRTCHWDPDDGDEKTENPNG